jgi:flagellar protein FlaG
MVGNMVSVTAEPARTSAPSVPHSNRKEQEPAATTGKFLAMSGESLPPAEARELDIERAVERLNELAKDNRRSLSFRLDEQSGRTVITVLNASTQEIVRQIPSEEVLAFARSLGRSGGSIDVLV